MRKNHAFFAGAAIVAMIAYACTMPTSIEIKADKFTRSLPIKLGTFDVAKLVADGLAGAFPEGFEIYDMVDYPNAKAFLVACRMNVLESFDPSKFLDDLEGRLDDIENMNQGIDPISSDTITIPKIEPVSINQAVLFDMESTLSAVEEQIRIPHSPTAIAGFNPVPIGSGIPSISFPPDFDDFINQLPDIGIIDGSDDYDYDFEAIILGSGTISLTLALTPYGGGVLDNDIDITLTGIALKDHSDNNFGSTDTYEAELNRDNNFTHTVAVPLAGHEIEKSGLPRFVIGGITSHYDGSLKPVSFNLTAKVELDDVKLRGARGMKFKEIMQDFPPNSTADFQSLIEDNFNDMLDDLPDQLLNAEIGEGSFSITVTLPAYTNATTTYCEGIDLEYKIQIKQEPVVFFGESFGGLSDGSGGPFEINHENSGPSATNNLGGIKINKGNLSIIGDVEISVKPSAAGVNFEFFGDPSDARSLPVTVAGILEIKELSVVRWKLENLASIDPIEIDFGDMGGTDLSQIIKSITFKKITLGLDFSNPPPSTGSSLPPILDNRLAIKVDCEDIGFNDVVKNLNNSNINGDNNPYLNEITSTPKKFELADANGNARTVTAELSLIPIIGGVPRADLKYAEFGSLNVASNNDLSLNAAPKLHFEWTEAEVDLRTLPGSDEFGGSFPEVPINLYDELGQYMHGIKLGSNIKGKVFLGGHKDLINMMQPNLKLDAKWEELDDSSSVWEEKEEVLFSKTLTALDMDELDKITLPGKNANGQLVYRGTDLPYPNMGIPLSIKEGGIKNLNDAICALPNKLSLTYELAGADHPIIITPDIVDVRNPGEKGFTVLFMMMIPLELEAEPGAYFAMPDGVFGEGDILGRESVGMDSIFTDINVRSLGIKIDFDRALFRDAYLHIDKNDILFPDGFPLNSGNSVGITLSGDDLEIVRENLIIPAIKIEFPKGSSIQIPKHFMPTRITIAASASYKIDFASIEEMFGF